MLMPVPKVLQGVPGSSRLRRSQPYARSRRRPCCHTAAASGGPSGCRTPWTPPETSWPHSHRPTSHVQYEKQMQMMILGCPAAIYSAN